MTKNIVGFVLKLFISQKGNTTRIEKDSLELDIKGVVDDKFYDKNISRSVLVASTYSYELAKKNNIDIAYGTLGENILIDFNPYSYKIGTQISIGEIVLEITAPCTICSHLSVIDKRLPTLLLNDRGIFFKVVKCGIIYVADKIVSHHNN